MPELPPASSRLPRRALLGLVLAGAGLLLAGCPRSATDELPTTTTADGRTLTKVVLQTDWYAQPEHGGFYQALVAGLYEKAGLDVEIRQGGPNALATERIVLGEAQFAITSASDLLIQRSRGTPLVILAPFFQHDPQGILFHRSSGIQGFRDLAGRRVMAGVGAAWVEVVKRRVGIDFDTLPLDFGMERFMADTQFVQQCFVTSEPYYARLNGADVDTLLIADSGFDPYRVIYAHADFVAARPEIVRAFVEASLEGWRQYMFGDRSAANARIASLNPKQTPEFMAFNVAAMERFGLVAGRGGSAANVGAMSRERLEATARDLALIGLIPEAPAVETFARFEFLPGGIVAPTEGVRP